MTWIDWSIVVGLICFVAFIAISTRKYNKSVADFLSANRCGGRYLLATGIGVAGMAAISVVMIFEATYNIGFVKHYWELLSIPIGTVMALSGWIIYRFRATRALTMAQFYEMRYSRKFRIFAGFLAWFAGIVNFGIFPAIGAQFFISFCGLPVYTVDISGFDINLTIAVVMLIILSFALFITFCSGQISIMITDFWQGLFITIVFTIIVFFLLFKFPLDQISEGLKIASEPGQSLINPFDIAQAEDFNFFYYCIMYFLTLYTAYCWQGAQAYNASAITPHEAKMASVVGGLRMIVPTGMLLIPLVAIAYMNHPVFAHGAAEVTQFLQQRFPDNAILQRQMRVPVVLSHVLPKGLLGMFTAAMFAFSITNHSTYMHSWGSIFVQDVLAPLRKNPLSTEQHLRWLRWSIIGVAFFAFVFGLVFPVKDYIGMFFQISGAIFVGGAGSVTIGGLYWKRGTTAAAWTAMIIGSGLAVTSIVLQGIWDRIPWLTSISEKFPFNGMVMSFWAGVAAITAYIMVSLLGKRSTIDMDKLLHRGKYGIEEEKREVEAYADHQKVGRFWKMIGVNSHEFSKVDKGLFLFTFIYSAYGMVCFFALFVLHFMGLMSEDNWLIYHWYGLFWVYFIIGVIGAIWIGIGGLFDIHFMFRRLKSIKRNEFDDGRITNDQNVMDKANTDMVGDRSE